MHDERSDVEAGAPGSDEMAGAVESGAGAAAAPGRRKRRTPKEIGGPAGPEPTRYGDWERKGIASDF